jgi:hypothetical protein
LLSFRPVRNELHGYEGTSTVVECELRDRCGFYNDEIAGMPPTARFLKDTYCLKDPSFCARFIVFDASGEESIPADLLPHETDKIKHLL